MSSELLTTKEVCERLKIGRSTLYGLAASGKIRRVKVGASTRWRPEEVERFIAGLKGGRR